MANWTDYEIHAEDYEELMEIFAELAEEVPEGSEV